MADIHRKKARPQRARREEAPDAPDYDTLLLLERLESLLEEMEELEVSSRAEIEARIAALHQALDTEEG
ncbi:MAG TPA: hypothetical protein VH599_21930 [Ktedonobacterales bacterium]|jgi:uncharacterized membrane protein